VAGHQYQIPEVRRREGLGQRRTVLAQPAAAGAASASQATEAVRAADAAAAAVAGCGAPEAGGCKPDLAGGSGRQRR